MPRILRRTTTARLNHHRSGSTSSSLIIKRDGQPTSHIVSERAFLDFERSPEPYRRPEVRVNDWREINDLPQVRDPTLRKIQAARCMNCGTPFCQTHTGCPVHNLIPEFNALVYEDEWKQANDRLHKTNNFPEFTGRVCPAPCEGACVAGRVVHSRCVM